jgi:ribosomal protein S18 acetylase RimI-like enzyme
MASAGARRAPGSVVLRDDRADTEVVVLGPDDWERARALRLAALADAPDAFWSTLAEEVDDPEQRWRDRLARDDATTLVARRTGEDVGLVVVAPDHHEPTSAGLVSVWVAPAARRHGVGRRLVRAGIEVARATGAPRLLLDVGDHNEAAVALYHSLGFRPTGRRGAFPPPREHIVEHQLALDLPLEAVAP